MGRAANKGKNLRGSGKGGAGRESDARELSGCSRVETYFVVGLTYFMGRENKGLVENSRVEWQGQIVLKSQLPAL